MSGFKSFVLRGNLVDLAVAVIIGTAFGTVVKAFTAWLTGLLPGAAKELFKGAQEGSAGYFINSVIAFVILAAVVYFFVVLPYTKAKEKYFPGEAEGPTDNELLSEIRDLLKTRA